MTLNKMELMTLSECDPNLGHGGSDKGRGVFGMEIYKLHDSE